MKRLFSSLLASAAIGLVAVPADAALIDRGADSLGYHLIYDSDLNITWYDFTRSFDTWQNQVNWASTLDVNFGGTDYTDWRLPSTLQPYTSCYGYGCTGSEMGHLFYTELGNSAGGPMSTSFTDGLTGNTESFALQTGYYWSGTEIFPGFAAYFFRFGDGYEVSATENQFLYAMVVRNGDVSAVPEPSTLLLLGSGITGLVAMRRFRKQ